MKRKSSVFVLNLFWLLNVFVYAEPLILSVNGATLPLTTSTINFSTAQFTKRVSEAIKTNNFKVPTPPAFSGLPLFPLITASLTPGEVITEQVNYPELIQPFFIIGTDKNSEQWLVKYHSQLKKLQAQGFVVNINSEHELQALYALATDIVLMPINGTKLATRFNLTHYPVLVSKTVMEQ